ncbi:hypothetical protein [Luteibacter sp.]|jgi:hypothetical protein|uniref:hypothetical protein n=1 Tax=Luteibacter sp. TaxID=1886636 RepID=UPI002F41880C
MGTAPLQIATITSVIAESAEYIGYHEAKENDEGATPIAEALIAAGARVEAMIAVVTLTKALLDQGVSGDFGLLAQLRAAVARAESLPNTREHCEAMALAAQVTP